MKRCEHQRCEAEAKWAAWQEFGGRASYVLVCDEHRTNYGPSYRLAEEP